MIESRALSPVVGSKVDRVLFFAAAGVFAPAAVILTAPDVLGTSVWTDSVPLEATGLTFDLVALTFVLPVFVATDFCVSASGCEFLDEIELLEL